MKKTIYLENLDCAVCAGKMEDGIRKIPGVQAASVSFLTQKIVLEAEENQMEEVVQQVKKVCRRIEPDCTLKL